MKQTLSVPVHSPARWILIDFAICFSAPSLREDGSGSAYDKESMAIIKLNNTTVLYLKEVTKFLALVCILREESFERKGEPSPQSGVDWKVLAVSGDLMLPGRESKGLAYLQLSAVLS